MTRGSNKSYVEFTYDIIWHEDLSQAEFYKTKKDAEDDIPMLMERESQYCKEEITMQVREVEINLV